MKFRFTPRCSIIAAVLCGCFLPIRNVQADLIISFGSTNIPGGQTGTLDVFLSSDQVGGDLIKEGSIFFEIVPYSGVGDLQFLPDFGSANSSKQSNSEQLATNYIYSQNVAPSPTNFSSVRQDPDKLKLVQYDSSGDGKDVQVFFATPKLVAKLDLLQLIPGATGEFRVYARQDTNATLFFNESGAVNINTDSYTNYGVITSAVPEPTSLALLSFAGALTVMKRWRRSN